MWEGLNCFLCCHQDIALKITEAITTVTIYKSAKFRVQRSKDNGIFCDATFTRFLKVSVCLESNFVTKLLLLKEMTNIYQS